MRLALLATVLLTSGCYAEWDLPRCGQVDDCPSGFSSCYDGHCLRSPLAGVDKAPVDVIAPADVATDGAEGPDSAQDPADVAGPCVASSTADGCCPIDLLHLDQDPDCAAWVVADLSFTTVAPAVVDAERERLVLAIRDGSGAASLRVLRLDSGAPAIDPVPVGWVSPPCPLLLADGSVVYTSAGYVRRVPLDGAASWSEVEVAGVGEGCAALHEPSPESASIIVVTAAIPEPHAAAPSVVAINTSTGARRWTWPSESPAALSAPIVRNGVVVTAGADDTLWRVDFEADATTPQGTSLALPGPALLAPTGAPDSGVHVVYAGKKPGLLTARFDGFEWAEVTGADDTPLDLAPLPGSEVVILEDLSPVVGHSSGFSALPAPATDVAPCEAKITTGPVVAAGGALLFGTSRGAAAVDRGGKVLWCYETGRTALLPPVPLPGGDVILVGEGVVLRVRAPSGPLAVSPWPRPRQGLANSAAISL